jgi:Protein of unknown function (DUF664)
MGWIAPQVSRGRTPRTGDERTLLDAWLEFHRATLLTKCAGLTAEQLAERSAAPSTLSLIGLVRHMAEIERSWFRHGFAREQVGGIYYTDDKPDADFEDATAETAEQDLETYRREVELARAAVTGHSLEETFYQERREAHTSLRWIYLHMIEEYARHNGHADIVREHLDGATGI